ncbi:MAG TPA: HD domain-containing phosphohydrolase [Vicinamibacterales bacterium]|nr:HD domain-containing phosphohydrolase [Vicinamibacterales bacterium]
MSKTARLFVAGVAAGGIVIAAHCLAVVVSTNLPPQWYVFGALTIATGTLTLKIPSIAARLAVSEIFAFACVLLFGPEPGALTLAIDGVLISLRWRHDAHKTFFNFGNLAASTWLSGVVLFRVSGVPPLFSSSPGYAALIGPLALMTLTYFVCNSGLTATAIALESGQKPWKVWREHFMALGPSYFAGASVALLLVVAMRQVHFGALALVLPVLVISYLTLHSSFGRLEDSKSHLEQLNRLQLSTVETLATAIDAKDEVTHDHVRRVQAGALALARELGVTDAMMLKALEAAALLHDTGKIAIPEHILNKPGRLTAAEFEKMKLHAPIGAEILSSIEFPYPVVPIVRHHHENWDGTGYPDGIKGTDIPFGARILSVVDCFDALTSDRPYRRRLANEDALAILIERRGTMYDPLVVDAFVAAHGRLMPVATTAPHPVARAVGEARAATRDEPPVLPVNEPGASDELLAVGSLARALSGGAGLADAGALVWMIVRQLFPCSTLAVFTPDEAHDAVVARYTAGLHAAAIRGTRRAMGAGMAGWVAVNRRPAINADATLDFALPAGTLTPPLASAVAIPLVTGDTLAGVLALYATEPQAFRDDHERLLALLAPHLAASFSSPLGADAPASSDAARRHAELKLVARAAAR